MLWKRNLPNREKETMTPKTEMPKTEMPKPGTPTEMPKVKSRKYTYGPGPSLEMPTDAVTLAQKAGVTRQYIYGLVKKGKLLTMHGKPHGPYYFTDAQVQGFLHRDVQACGYPTHRSQRGANANLIGRV